MFEVEAVRGTASVGSTDYWGYGIVPGIAYWFMDGLHAGAQLQASYGVEHPDLVEGASLSGTFRIGYTHAFAPGWWAVEAVAQTTNPVMSSLRALAEFDTGYLRPVVGTGHVAAVGDGEGWRPHATSLLAGAILRTESWKLLGLMDGSVIHADGRQNTFVFLDPSIDGSIELSESSTLGARAGYGRSFGRENRGIGVATRGLRLSLYVRFDVGD